MGNASVSTLPFTLQASTAESRPGIRSDAALGAYSAGWTGAGTGISGIPLTPEYPEKLGEFYSPREAFNRLKEAAHKYGVNKLRTSGAEPTLGKNHLLSLLEHVEQSTFPLFILETNGILFGVDKDYVKRVSKFTKPHVRVSLKAGTPEDFTRKTGAKPEAFEIPFQAIRNLMDYNVSFHVAAMSADPRIMTQEERGNLVKKLVEIDPQLLLSLEEEVMDPYNTTLERLKIAGLKVRWPLRRVYTPVRGTLKREKEGT